MRATLLILLILSTGVIGAQNWALPSSKWKNTVYHFAAYPTPNATLSVEKDTIVESITCTKIVSDYNPNDVIFTYSSGDTVFMYRDSIFYPVLYFNAHAGDTIQVYNDHNSSCCIDVRFWKGYVDSVAMITANGQNLKKFYARITDSLFGCPGECARFEYAEKLGLLSSYVNPFYQSSTSMIDGDMYDLCNYGDSSMTGFWLYPDSNCRVTIGVHDIGRYEKLTIYPNPASDILYINPPSIEVFRSVISDVAGRDMRSEIRDHSIDIHDLTPGIYILSITTADGEKLIRRFTKE